MGTKQGQTNANALAKELWWETWRTLGVYVSTFYQPKKQRGSQKEKKQRALGQWKSTILYQGIWRDYIKNEEGQILVRQEKRIAWEVSIWNTNNFCFSLGKPKNYTGGPTRIKPFEFITD